MMVRIIQWFLMTLGFIFFVLLIGLVYVFVVDPFELRPLFSGGANQLVSQDVESLESSGVVEAEGGDDQSNQSATAAALETSTDTTHEPAGPALSPAQRSALELVGIDPETLPRTITPEQEQCFVAVIGATRVDAIKAGDAPTPLEIFAGRRCL